MTSGRPGQGTLTIQVNVPLLAASLPSDEQRVVEQRLEAAITAVLDGHFVEASGFRYQWPSMPSV